MAETYPFSIPSGTNIIPEGSGTQSFGSTSNPFSSINTNQIIVSGQTISTTNIGMYVFTSSNTFTVPIGITKIHAKMWGAGGGGGGGGGVVGIGGPVTSGTSGIKGDDSWFKFSGNNARGGLPGGGGGLIGGDAGSGTSPLFSPQSVRYGNLGVINSITPSFQNIITAVKGNFQNEINGENNTGAPGGRGDAGFDGVSTFGQYGGDGAFGEYAEWVVDVTPEELTTVHVGSGVSGGIGGSGTFSGGDGGDAGSGLVILAW